MDAQTLYQQGIVAIRERKDLDEGRRLLTQSLKLNPQNDMAWLWLSRALTDPQRQRQAIQRALSINPQNAKARELLERIDAGNGSVTSTTTTAALTPTNAASSKKPSHQQPAKRLAPPTQAQLERIAVLMRQANEQETRGDDEGAVENWVSVLDIQPDHDGALKNAIKTLVRLGFEGDAKELLQRAIDAGSTHPSIYLTAMDFARRDKDHIQLDKLRAQVVNLPEADENLIIKVVDEYVSTAQYDQAENLLDIALHSHNDAPKLLLRMGEVQKALGRPREAMTYFNQAAKLGVKSKEGKVADKLLSEYAPVLTDRERGSLPLALRETAGIGIFFLILAWQDTGLDLLAMDFKHWLGILLSLVGGYLLVTATSSPQQEPVAKLLGGSIQNENTQNVMVESKWGGPTHEVSHIPVVPQAVRWVLGGIGAALLVVAFFMVFSVAVDLLRHFDEVPYPYSLF